MGAIDINSADVVVPSPVPQYFRFICDLPVLFF